MEQCVFCKIIGGETAESPVYSDEKVLAFMDIRPVNPGHVLVIPKIHASGLGDLNEETGAHIFRIGMRVANALKKSSIKCEGINLFLSDGKAAFQEIFHVHLHVIPRFKGDGFRLSFGQAYASRPDREELNRIAAKIRAVLR